MTIPEPVADEGVATKPKSIKKKKKKAAAADGTATDTPDGGKPKKKKKAKAAGAAGGNDGVEKPKSTKKKKKKTAAAASAEEEEELIEIQRPARGTAGRGPPPPPSFRAGPGRQPHSYRVGGGRGPGKPPSMNNMAMNHSGHYGAPSRPPSMNNMNHSGHYGAPSRPPSMRGPPPGRGRGGNSMHGSMHGRSQRGRGPPPPGLGGGSNHGGAYRAPTPGNRPGGILRTGSIQPGRGRGTSGGAVVVGADGSIRHMASTPSNSNLMTPPPPGSSRNMMRGNSYRGGMNRGSSHGNLNSSNHSRGGRGPGPRGNSRNFTRDNSVDSFDIDKDDDVDGKNGGGGVVVSAMPGMVIEGLSKSLRNIMGTSERSLGMGGASNHEPNNNYNNNGDRRGGMTSLSNFSSNQSMRSVLSAEMDYREENRCIACLRYVRLLPPHPDEKPLKRRCRIATWTALILDLLAAVVAITTYGGVTLCCGEPMMNVAGEFPWDKVITVVTYIYIVLILLEVLPVVRDGFPFNLFNPIVGFLITFAVFFDDSVTEAAIMWSIEASAVFCEVYIYHCKSRLYQDRIKRLDKTEEQIKNLRTVKKRVKAQYESGRALNVSSHSLGSLNDSMSSFHDESVMLGDDPSVGTDISKVRETRLYRERRILRESNALDRRELRYHFVGVCQNVFLVFVCLMVIIVIAKNKGLCIVDMKPPNVFTNNQLERCFSCANVDGVCEICNPDGTSQCYYPYGRGA